MTTVVMIRPHGVWRLLTIFFDCARLGTGLPVRLGTPGLLAVAAWAGGVSVAVAWRVVGGAAAGGPSLPAAQGRVPGPGASVGRPAPAGSVGHRNRLKAHHWH